MSKNSVANRKVTEVTLESEWKLARDCEFNSKDQAARAVGHCLLLWRDTQGPSAKQEAKEWLKRSIESENAAITAENKLIDERKANGPKLVKISKRTGAEPSTEFVKFTFKFRRKQDASKVSRCAKALTWAIKQDEKQSFNSIEEVVDRIDKAGGYETIVSNKNPKPPAANDNKALEAVAEAIKRAAREKDFVGQFPASVITSNGLVVSIGRYEAGTVKVVANVGLPDDMEAGWAPLFDAQLGPAIPETTGFVTRVLALGELVSKGKVSGIDEDFKEERILTLLPGGQDGGTLVVSARHASASIVVEAKPIASDVRLGVPSSQMAMVVDDLDTLYEEFEDRYARYSIGIAPSGGGELLTWTLTKTTAGDKPKILTWEDIANHTRQPLIVDHFDPQFSVKLSIANAARLHDERLHVWADKQQAEAEKARKEAAGTKKAGTAQKPATKKPPKERKTTTLRFEGNTVTYRMKDDVELPLPLTGSVSTPVEMQFRPYDLLNLLNKLKLQDTQEFVLKGDSDGLLCVSWSDKLGEYKVYLPTAADKGRSLETKRLSQMRLQPQKIAA